MIIFDPQGTYYRKSESHEIDHERIAREGFQVVHTPDQLKAAVRENFKGQFRILYVPLGGDVQWHWTQVGTIAFAAGNLMLCIDELGMLCENGKICPDVPKVKGGSPILMQIIHYGRHRRVQVVSTCQLPTDVALRYRGLCTDIRMFQLDEKAHLEYLAGKVGYKTAGRLPKLKKYDYVVWTDNGEVFQSRTERS